MTGGILDPAAARPICTVGDCTHYLYNDPSQILPEDTDIAFLEEFEALKAAAGDLLDSSEVGNSKDPLELIIGSKLQFETADIEGIIETLLAPMTEIDEDTQTVHLTDHLFTEGTHTVVGVVATGGVADIVVAVMTEGDIHHTAISEVLQILELAFEGQSVLDAQHDTLQTLVLVQPEVVGGTG